MYGQFIELRLIDNMNICTYDFVMHVL